MASVILCLCLFITFFSFEDMTEIWTENCYIGYMDITKDSCRRNVINIFRTTVNMLSRTCQWRFHCVGFEAPKHLDLSKKLPEDLQSVVTWTNDQLVKFTQIKLFNQNGLSFWIYRFAQFSRNYETYVELEVKRKFMNKCDTSWLSQGFYKWSCFVIRTKLTSKVDRFQKFPQVRLARTRKQTEYESIK